MRRPPPLSWPYGTAAPGPGGGGGCVHPPPFLQNSNFQFPANIQYFPQPPNFPHGGFQNPRAVQPQNASIVNAGFPAAPPSSKPSVRMDTIESEAMKVHRELVVTGENISATKVSQLVLDALKVDSWSSLGYRLQDVPTIQRLLVNEGKVDALIHCFVLARKITTLYELELFLCHNMSIKRFEELGLGPLLHHPLVRHYFAVPSVATEVFKITSEEIILSLQEFTTKSKKQISAERFRRFLAKQKSVPSKELLGVRIGNIGFYMHHIQEANKAEDTLLREKLYKSRPGGGNKEIVRNMCGFRLRRIAAEKKIIDERFDYISSRVKTFSSTLKDSSHEHVYFISSDDGDDSKVDNVVDVEDDEEGKTAKDCGQLVTSCPYPSNSEEMARLGLKPVESYKTTPNIGHFTNKENMKSFKRKRKHENNNSASSSCKYLKVKAVDLKDGGPMCGLTLSNGDVEKFVATWKVACQKHSLAEVLDMMLSFYVGKPRRRKKIKKIVSSHPLIGWFNVAVTSIKRGMFESLYDTFQALDEKELTGADAVCLGEMMDVTPTVKFTDPTSIDCCYGKSPRVSHICIFNAQTIGTCPLKFVSICFIFILCIFFVAIVRK